MPRPNSPAVRARPRSSIAWNRPTEVALVSSKDRIYLPDRLYYGVRVIAPTEAGFALSSLLPAIVCD